PVALVSGPSSLVSVVRLSTGQPLAGVAVRQRFPGRAPVDLGRTDGSGVLRGPGLAAWASAEGPSLLSFTAPDRQDWAYLPLGSAADLWRPPPPRPGLRRGERLISRLISDRGA